MIQNKLLLLCIGLIPLLSFAPLVPFITGYGDDLGYLNTLKMIFLSFSIGKAWILTLLVSFLLFILLSMKDVKNESIARYIAIGFLFILLVAVGMSGHAAALSPAKGTIAHTLHFLSVVVWVGVLFVVGWFSDGSNWLKFLKWFTPFAVICLIIAMIAGFITMQIDIDTYKEVATSVFTEYKNSLMVNYGQSLLLKHILVIPLLIMAFINSFITRKKLKENKDFNPLRWIKVEAIIIFIIFMVTAYLGQQFPPHQVAGLIKVFGPNPIFDYIYQGDILPESQVMYHFTWISYLLFGMAFLFCISLILSVYKKINFLGFFLHLSFIAIIIYFGIMYSIRLTI